MRSLKHIVFGIFGSCVAAIFLVMVPGNAEADYATGGAGSHINSIIWAEWGAKGDVIPAEGLTRTQYTNVGGTRIALECSISQPAPGSGYGYDARSSLDVWTSGTWYKDGLDDLYNRGGVGVRNQMTSAIHTKETTATVSFRIICSAVVTGPGFPTGGQRIPVDGLVVADAESSNPQPDEYIKVETDASAQWRIFDRIRDQNCSSSTTADISDAGGKRTMTFLPAGIPCPRTGPMAVGVASNVSEATITMFGQGKAAVAVGAVLNLDYGDAPISYGAAAAQYPTGWVSPPLPLGTTDAFAAPLGQMGTPTVMLGRRIDPESVNPADGDGTQDDRNPADTNDEDAISTTPLYHVVRGGGTAMQEITCTGNGYNRGWVDWNRNGTFDDNESSDTVQCAGGKSTLKWTIPATAIPGDSYLRLRAAATADSLTRPTGLTVTGEVEDHKVEISTYDLAVTKSSDALAGKKFAGDEVTYTATATNITRTPFTNVSSAYLFDDLTGVLDDADLIDGSVKATVGGVNRGYLFVNTSAQRIGWRGALRPGETLTLTYRVRLKVGGDRNLTNIAWGQMGLSIPSTKVTCENPTDNGRDQATNYPCAKEQYTMMSLLKTFRTSHDPNPSAADWTLTATGNFGGEPDDTERVVSGATTATNANTFVVPVGESFRFTEHAAAGIMEGYELQNPGLTAVGGHQVELINSDKPASATWSKTDKETGELIGGSEWRLTGPTSGDGVTITDCIATDSALCMGPDKDPKAGSFMLAGLAWGEHTLTEVAPPPGYTLPDSPEHPIRLGSAHAGANPLKIGAIPNDHIPGSLSWRKVEAGTVNPLTGSVWKLTSTSGTTIADITDCIAPGHCSGHDKDPAPGSFRVEELSWGTWRLVETSAPLGYLTTTREETILISRETMNYVVAEPFENTRAPLPVLPLTGGTPSDLYRYSGGGLLAIATVLTLLRNHRRRQHP